PVTESFAPARAQPVEEPRAPVGIAFAVRKPAPEEAVAARHAIYRGHGRGERLRDARRELGRDALVGVEAKHPVVLCLVDRELLLAPEAEPLLLHDARVVAPGDVERAVAGIRIDDQDVVGELQALQ